MTQAFGRDDRWPLALIVLLPIILALPQLFGAFADDPLFHRASIASSLSPGIIPGVPYIDPNDGFQTQALGFRAAKEWIRGHVPWWNPYAGVGMPLAAEYQGAAFFPLSLLLLLPKGMLLQHLLLQVLAGFGTYGLLRQMGTTRVAALAGGLAYAFNGTLAWFAHGPAQPVPFLPWMLWGIERAHTNANAATPGGWRMLACAMAMSLLAGFPETAYIGGLFAFAWSILRGAQAEPAARKGYAARIALGGIAGIAIAAPQVMAFFHYLAHADIAGHADRFATEALRTTGLVQSFIAPYAHGPIHAYTHLRPWLEAVWGGIGGYVTLVLIVIAAYGFAARRGALRWLLVAWCALAWMKTFSIQPGLAFFNFVPGITLTAFYRYAPASWELALVILAALGLDAVARGQGGRRAWIAALLFGGGAAIVAARDVADWWPSVERHDQMRTWMAGSMLWCAVSVSIVLAAIRFMPARRAAATVAAILALDAAAMFVVPTLSNPRDGKLDLASIKFLRDNLELQRFFSLGPISPNYGAYFGLASINHNYLPVPRRWVEFVRRRLDQENHAEVFDGRRHWGERPSGRQLGENIAAYREVGVKYVVAEVPDNVGLPIAYKGEAMTIYELPGHSPYFEPLGAKCRVDEAKRTSAIVTCDAPATLVRRELYFPGWSATVSGKEVEIAEHGELFQRIALPAGKSDVRFSYAPPHIGWAWLAAALGAAALVAPLGSRLRRRFTR